VTVLRAKNLLKMDVLGKADPYVKLQLVNTLMSKKTHTKMNTLNPEWNETFKLLVQDPKSQSLELHVYDWDRVSLFIYYCLLLCRLKVLPTVSHVDELLIHP
jgi:Ca2+-dependent lipid-binding protein